MHLLLPFFQLLIAVLLIGSILLQRRGGGLSPVFGGGSGFYRTRRGVERMFFIGTVVLSFLFLASAILNIVLQ